jgi:hypothetical protein
MSTTESNIQELSPMSTESATEIRLLSGKPTHDVEKETPTTTQLGSVETSNAVAPELVSMTEEIVNEKAEEDEPVHANNDTEKEVEDGEVEDEGRTDGVEDEPEEF